MSLAHDFTTRMQEGKETAAARRYRGKASGKGWGVISSAAANDAWAAAYPTDSAREQWIANQALFVADHQHLSAADVQAFCGDLTGLPAEAFDDLEMVGEELAPLPLAIEAQRGPARPPAGRRQQKGPTMVDMTAKEFERTVEKLFGSVYSSAPHLGMSYRQLRRMAIGEMPVHPALSRLLRLMVDGKHKSTDLR